jgi:hypothetical protein
MISALYFSPIELKNFTASSRFTLLSGHRMSFFARSAMRFSIFSRSSGVKGRLNAKS